MESSCFILEIYYYLICQLYLRKTKNKYLFTEEMLGPRLKGTLSSPESQMRKLRPGEAGPRSHSYWWQSLAIHTSLQKPEWAPLHHAFEIEAFPGPTPAYRCQIPWLRSTSSLLSACGIARTGALRSHGGWCRLETRMAQPSLGPWASESEERWKSHITKSLLKRMSLWNTVRLVF